MQDHTSVKGGSRQIRIVLSTTALLSFISVWKAAAFVFAELGVGIFFAIGVERNFIGDSAPWFVLGVCALSFLVRAIDIESWAFFVPGGLIGRAQRAYGDRAGGLATAVMLVERLLLVVLASVLCVQYSVSFMAGWIAQWSVTARLTVQELVTTGAIVLIGLLWTRSRLRLPIASHTLARAVWAGVVLLFLTIGIGIATAVVHHHPLLRPALVPPWQTPAGAITFSSIGRVFIAFALAIPLLGGGGALGRAAREFAPPRMPPVRRTARYVAFFVSLLAVSSSFLYVALIPASEGPAWAATPLTALTQYTLLPPWASGLLTLLVLGAALAVLIPAAQSAMEDAELILRRLSLESLGPSNVVNSANVVAGIAVLVTLAGGAQVTWLSRAYGIAIAVALLLRIAVNDRLRRTAPEPPPFRVSTVVRIAIGFLVGAPALALILTGDLPAILTLASITVAGLLLAGRIRTAAATASPEDDPFELAPSGDVSLGQVDARPGNVLVAVKHPDSLGHLVKAIHAAGDRDVVAVTVRVLGVDVDDETGEGSGSTREERRLFSQVVRFTERYTHPIRLLIVPAQNIFDGVITVALRLGSSEVYVSESDTLTATDQARLLGESWERAKKEDDQKLRLVICHGSGRTDAFHLGAHPPALSPQDLDLIHRMWLDAVKNVGPHVHHHDVVRAALKQMENKLTGPDRGEILEAIRQTARPADDLASALQANDYTRLRDLVRNRHASELAEALTGLGIEQQVIVFRILPRKNAAAVFEYLSLEQQEALLKAMAHEDVAALLNSMAPDDRTMFLEELPAAVTRQLLTMLTPAERNVALKLLGYPEGSIGRLMTPNYVSVREHWTIREVLDFIRTHGQDSETLNMVYVVDEQGMLIDDIRIREFLLAPLEKSVFDLMDRRFVALKATDAQTDAISIFKQYDRTALPVTDTAGVLIGIVTIDDVLDVAEAVATQEIQRIGGSEALDEPYMQIQMHRMVRKRAGWLSALFLGEMLTAVAMGFFQDEISRVVQLALFIPLIISSGGNSGSQAATLVIRALALGEVTLADWWRVIRREVVAGLSLGVILAVIGFLRISIWGAFFKQYGADWLMLGFTVAFALVGVVLWGSLVGSILPIILQKLGFDPATSSAPFVATLVDVTGLIIYFSVALVFMHGTL